MAYYMLVVIAIDALFVEGGSARRAPAQRVGHANAGGLRRGARKRNELPDLTD